MNILTEGTNMPTELPVPVEGIFYAYMHESKEGRGFAVEEFSELVLLRRAEAVSKGEQYRPVIVEVFESSR